MTIAQARAVSSDLIVIHRSPAAESSAHSALLDAAESVSPVIESGAPGCAWVDLAGLQRIYNSEEEITAELIRCVRRVGMEPRRRRRRQQRIRRIWPRDAAACA